MPTKEITPTTLEKALKINLDDKKYGTIAEIGAGQEVGRNFFSAGAAAGTIAKTMSAYDMQFSDAIYGQSGRYVSKERVQAMIGKEFELVVERVKNTRSRNSRFFAYGSTAAAKSYRGDNECHAWCGVRMQMYPGAEPCDIIIHLRMHDNTVEKQQEALGIVGVNLIYAGFFYYDDANKIIDSLTDNLERDRVEIDLIQFDGDYFEDIDNRGINFQLIRGWKTRAVMFRPDGSIAIPANMLYKKNVIAIRGSFRPVTKLNVDMIEQGKKSFYEMHPEANDDNTLAIAEISLNDAHGKDLGATPQDIIARVHLLNSLGYTVMISDYTRFFSLRAYFRQFTDKKIGIVLGIINIKQIFDEETYRGVEGGMLEGFGKLFPDNTNLLVYPELGDGDQLRDYTQVKFPDRLNYLYQHLLANNFLSGIEPSDTAYFKIYSRQVLKALREGRGEWENMLPDGIAEQIIENRFFDFKGR